MGPNLLKRNLYVSLFIIILTSSCNIQMSQSPRLTVTISSPHQTSTIPKSIESRPNQTTWPNNPPKSPEPTLTKLLPTLAIHPTLTAAEAKEEILGVLKDNGGCQLPCLWGITPGSSNLDSINAFLSPFYDLSVDNEVYIFSHMREQGGSVTYILWNDNIRLPIRFSYYKDESGTINYVTMSTQAGREEGAGVEQSIKAVYGSPFLYQTLNYYLLSNILSKYGYPTKILIGPFPDDPEYSSDAMIPFSVVLFYQDQGIFVEYILPKEMVGENLVGCPAKVGYLTFIVWPPGQHLPIETVASMSTGLGINSTNVNYFKSIEDATKLMVEDFHKTFINPDSTSCIETPKEIWQ